MCNFMRCLFLVCLVVVFLSGIDFWNVWVKKGLCYYVEWLVLLGCVKCWRILGGCCNWFVFVLILVVVVIGIVGFVIVGVFGDVWVVFVFKL